MNDSKVIFDEAVMKHFIIQELVDKSTYEKYGQSCWQLFPQDSLKMLAGVREFLGIPLTVNNWHKGGSFQYSGYRPKYCTVGAPLSYHRKGMAFDCKGSLTAQEMRDMIMADQDNPLLEKLTRMENMVSWLHVDCKPLIAPQKRIYLFNP